MYKHLEVPKDKKVIYLKATKRPHWKGNPSVKVDHDELKRGALTWVLFEQFTEDAMGILIEGNRFGMNFDESCFRFVDKDGKSIPAPDYYQKKEYRMYEKDELMTRGLWDYIKKQPKDLDSFPLLSDLLGKSVDPSFNKGLREGEGYCPDGGKVNYDPFVTNIQPVTSSTRREAELLQKRFDLLPDFLIKSKARFQSEELWHDALDMPVGWGENDRFNYLLGKVLPEEYNSICEKEENIIIGELVLTSQDYVKIDKNNLSKSFLLNYIIFQKSEIEGLKEETVEVESMEIMADVIEKIYDDDDLRKSIVPLFIGNPGLGKTKIIEMFSNKKGAKLVELITSQMNPLEISGISMPDKETKKMIYYNYDKMESLKDGDILFFDELLNGSPTVLNACLTVLEQRRLISGKPLPNVFILAAANPQGMALLTPQIKERFVWYNVEFSPNMWKKYMKEKYLMPEKISESLCELIRSEDFKKQNFFTPRSIDKAVNMILKNAYTPYYDDLFPILEKVIYNNGKEDKVISPTKVLKPGESEVWLKCI